jgi:hypothetical protein
MALKDVNSFVRVAKEYFEGEPGVIDGYLAVCELKEKLYPEGFDELEYKAFKGETKQKRSRRTPQQMAAAKAEVAAEKTEVPAKEKPKKKGILG